MVELPFEVEVCSVHPSLVVPSVVNSLAALSLCSVLLCSEAGREGEKKRKFRVQGSLGQSFNTEIKYLAS